MPVSEERRVGDETAESGGDCLATLELAWYRWRAKLMVVVLEFGGRAAEGFVPAVFDFKDLEVEGPQLVDGVDDVGEEAHGVEDYTAEDADYLGGLGGQAGGSSELEEGVGRRHYAWKDAYLGGSQGLSVLADERFTGDGKEGDDVEPPVVVLVWSERKPTHCC